MQLEIFDEHVNIFISNYFSQHFCQVYNSRRTTTMNSNCQRVRAVSRFVRFHGWRLVSRKLSASSSRARFYRQTNDLQTVPFSSFLSLLSFHWACRVWTRQTSWEFWKDKSAKKSLSLSLWLFTVITENMQNCILLFLCYAIKKIV